METEMSPPIGDEVLDPPADQATSVDLKESTSRERKRNSKFDDDVFADSSKMNLKVCMKQPRRPKPKLKPKPKTKKETKLPQKSSEKQKKKDATAANPSRGSRKTQQKPVVLELPPMEEDAPKVPFDEEAERLEETLIRSRDHSHLYFRHRDELRELPDGPGEFETLIEAIEAGVHQCTNLLLDWTSSAASLIGSLCRVFWDGENSWYYARVIYYDPVYDCHLIYYEDKTAEWLALHEENVIVSRGVSVTKHGQITWPVMTYWTSPGAQNIMAKAFARYRPSAVYVEFCSDQRAKEYSFVQAANIGPLSAFRRPPMVSKKLQTGLDAAEVEMQELEKTLKIIADTTRKAAFSTLVGSQWLGVRVSVLPKKLAKSKPVGKSKEQVDSRRRERLERRGKRDSKACDSVQGDEDDLEMTQQGRQHDNGHSNGFNGNAKIKPKDSSTLEGDSPAYSSTKGTIVNYSQGLNQHFVVFDDHSIPPRWITCNRSSIDILLDQADSIPAHANRLLRGLQLYNESREEVVCNCMLCGTDHRGSLAVSRSQVGAEADAIEDKLDSENNRNNDGEPIQSADSTPCEDTPWVQCAQCYRYCHTRCLPTDHTNAQKESCSDDESTAEDGENGHSMKGDSTASEQWLCWECQRCRTGCGATLWSHEMLNYSFCRIDPDTQVDKAPHLICGPCLKRYKHKQDFCPICFKLYPAEDDTLTDAPNQPIVGDHLMQMGKVPPNSRTTTYQIEAAEPSLGLKQIMSKPEKKGRKKKGKRGRPSGWNRKEQDAESAESETKSNIDDHAEGNDDADTLAAGDVKDSRAGGDNMMLVDQNNSEIEGCRADHEGSIVEANSCAESQASSSESMDISEAAQDLNAASNANSDTATEAQNMGDDAYEPPYEFNASYSEFANSMMMCSECSRWVHALCEGVDEAQFEAIASGTHPVWGAEYLCPSCRVNTSKNMIRSLQYIDASGLSLFAEPVTESIAETYFDIIRNPMDLQTMMHKALKGQYKSLQSLRADFELMCLNAIVFNKIFDLYWKEARRFHEHGLLLFNKQVRQTHVTAYGKEMQEIIEKAIPAANAARKQKRKQSKEAAVAEPAQDPYAKAYKASTSADIDSGNKKKGNGKSKEVSEAAGAPVIANGVDPNRKKMKVDDATNEVLCVPCGEDDKTSKPLSKYDHIFSQLPTNLTVASEPMPAGVISASLLCSEDAFCATHLDQCLLCGSAGSAEEFLFCMDCGEAFHSFCTGAALSQMTVSDKEQWRCVNCKVCSICYYDTSTNSTPEAEELSTNMITCAKCDRAYHPQCVTPRLPESFDLAKLTWYCHLCVCCSHGAHSQSLDNCWGFKFDGCASCDESSKDKFYDHKNRSIQPGVTATDSDQKPSTSAIAKDALPKSSSTKNAVVKSGSFLSCSICKDDCSEAHIECDNCKKMYHPECSGNAHIPLLHRTKEPIICGTCSSELRGSTFESHVGSGLAAWNILEAVAGIQRARAAIRDNLANDLVNSYHTISCRNIEEYKLTLLTIIRIGMMKLRLLEKHILPDSFVNDYLVPKTVPVVANYVRWRAHRFVAMFRSAGNPDSVHKRMAMYMYGKCGSQDVGMESIVRIAAMSAAFICITDSEVSGLKSIIQVDVICGTLKAIWEELGESEKKKLDQPMDGKGILYYKQKVEDAIQQLLAQPVVALDTITVGNTDWCRAKKCVKRKADEIFFTNATKIAKKKSRSGVTKQKVVDSASSEVTVRPGTTSKGKHVTLKQIYQDTAWDVLEWYQNYRRGLEDEMKLYQRDTTHVLKHLIDASDNIIYVDDAYNVAERKPTDVVECKLDTDDTAPETLQMTKTSTVALNTATPHPNYTHVISTVKDEKFSSSNGIDTRMDVSASAEESTPMLKPRRVSIDFSKFGESGSCNIAFSSQRVSRYRGVYNLPGSHRFVALYASKVSGDVTALGYFESESAAALAYDRGLLSYEGPGARARCNFDILGKPNVLDPLDDADEDDFEFPYIFLSKYPGVLSVGGKWVAKRDAEKVVYETEIEAFMASEQFSIEYFPYGLANEIFCCFMRQPSVGVEMLDAHGNMTLHSDIDTEGHSSGAQSDFMIGRTKAAIVNEESRWDMFVASLQRTRYSPTAFLLPFPTPETKLLQHQHQHQHQMQRSPDGVVRSPHDRDDKNGVSMQICGMDSEAVSVQTPTPPMKGIEGFVGTRPLRGWAYGALGNLPWTDNRRCSLCNGSEYCSELEASGVSALSKPFSSKKTAPSHLSDFGRERDPICGRLVSSAAGVHFHVNCLRFAGDVTEKNGIMTGCFALRPRFCSACKGRGATVICSGKGCRRSFHLRCALATKCVFYETKRTSGEETGSHDTQVVVACLEHAQEIMGSVDNPENIWLPRDPKKKLLMEESDAFATIAESLGEKGSQTGAKVGALTVLSVGNPRVEFAGFHTKHHIFPHKFQSVRIFWSMYRPLQRTSYTFDVLAETDFEDMSIDISAILPNVLSEYSEINASTAGVFYNTSAFAKSQSASGFLSSHDSSITAPPIFRVAIGDNSHQVILTRSMELAYDVITCHVSSCNELYRKDCRRISPSTSYGLRASQFFGIGLPFVRKAVEIRPESAAAVIASEPLPRYAPCHRIPTREDVAHVLITVELINRNQRVSLNGCARADLFETQSVISRKAQGSRRAPGDSKKNNKSKILTKITDEDDADAAASASAKRKSRGDGYDDDGGPSKREENWQTIERHKLQYAELSAAYQRNPYQRLEVKRSLIHGWGLFARSKFDKDEMIIEYIGEAIRQVVADRREQQYEDEGVGSCYLFRLDKEVIVDATRRGGMARFMNHCCEPCAYARVITTDEEKGLKHIIIFAARGIQEGEEITYDYKFPIEDEKLKCYCGAPRCNGSMN